MKQPLLNNTSYAANNDTICCPLSAADWETLAEGESSQKYGEVMTAAGQIKFLKIVLRSTANGGLFGPGTGNTVTFTVHVNGVASALAVSLSDSVYEGNNQSDSVTVNVGDIVTLVRTATGSSPTARIASIGSVFHGNVPLRSTYGGNIAPSSTAVRYLAPLAASVETATRRSAEGTCICGTYGSLTRMNVAVDVAPGTGKSWTIKLMKNGSYVTGAEVVIENAELTGSATFDETVVPVTVVAGVATATADELSYEITPSGTPAATRMAVGMRLDADSLEFVDEETEEVIAEILDNVCSLSRNLDGLFATGQSMYGSAPVVAGTVAEGFATSSFPNVDGSDFNVVLANMSVVLSAGPGASKERLFRPRVYNAAPEVEDMDDGYETPISITGTNTFGGAATVGGATVFITYTAAEPRFSTRANASTAGNTVADGWIGYMMFADTFDLTSAVFDGEVTSIVPDEGPTSGGTAFTITGSGFEGTVNEGANNITGVASVTLRGIAATDIVVVNDTTITGVSGQSFNVGVGDVVINFTTDTPGGLQAQGLLEGGWTYTSASVWWYNADTDEWFYGEEAPETNGDGVEYEDGDWVESEDEPDPYGWWFSANGLAGQPLVADGSGSPSAPRTAVEVDSFATGTAEHLQGQGVACVLRNRLIYAGRVYSGDPVLRLFDGQADRIVATVPPTTAGVAAEAIMSVIAANNLVYLTALDASAAGGRVFEFNPTTGAVRQIGDAFTSDEVPYALCWHMGRLWLVTNEGDGTTGKVYFIRPDLDSAWTLDYTFSSSTAGGGCSIASYHGRLFVGCDAIAAGNGKVLVRSALGVWSTSDTGAGTAVNNGYIQMVVFADKLYAAYWDSAGPTTLIRRYDDTSWSTVYTGAAHTALPVLALFTFADNIYALIGAPSEDAALIRSDTGSSSEWDDLTAFLPPGGIVATPAFGTLRR